jgi:hypothetical protein
MFFGEGDVLETRRELLRTSVVAAFAGAVVGYAVSRVFSPPQYVLSVTPLAGSVIAAWGQNQAGAYSWYFFVFGTDPSQCQLWSSTSPYPSSAPPSKINVVDTASWFTSLSSKSQVTQTTTLQYTLNDSTSGSITITFTKDGYLDPNSLSNLLGLLANSNIYTQIPASWNEIGKKKN